ncbi:MAG TPA: class I SAM-dependent methyltransferase [Bryobacteraceae bacterium]|nr:class I SAM-dependent methyltransferase [Bryobacteraceae bacterium]
MEEAAVPQLLTEYQVYVLEEWNRFTSDPARPEATLDAASGLDVSRVLDIGCGAGQEMLPFIERGAAGIGLDPAPETGSMRRLLPEHRSVTFVRGMAEHLPFAEASFDIIICRVALPYMNNKRALGEMARTLRSRGRLLLKIHAAPYYTHKFGEGIRRRDPLFSIHAARVLAEGILYHLIGRQLRVLSGETFQSERLLGRELQPLGLRITGHMRDTNPLTPSFIIEKIL